MNGNAVITNTETMQKWGIYSPLIYPRLSIIDPSVQSSLPFKQTANGAMDKLWLIFWNIILPMIVL